MNWLGMAFTVALVTTQSHFSTHPLAPWQQTSSQAYVWVVNETNDTVGVAVIARKIDHSVRVLGWVTARDSLMFRLPYADTKVLLLVGFQWVEFDVKGPTVTRYVHRLPGSQP